MARVRRLSIFPMAAAVAAVLSAGSGAAADRPGRAEITLARLAGPDRDAFIKSSIESCTSTAEKKSPSAPASAIKTYCTCMAGKVADVTTEADLTYMAAHHAATEEYKKRVLKFAPICNAAAGLH
jgi:hypothetical protein